MSFDGPPSKEQCHDVWLVGRFFSPWYGMILGPIMMIAFVALTVLIITWALRAFGLGWQSGPQGRNTPLDTLKHRFARGEIDRAEYEDRGRLLSDS